MKQYQIVQLDVWGNKHDGFDVNNWHHTGVYITLSDDVPPSARQVVSALKTAGYIKKNVRFASFGIFEHGDTLILEDAKTGEPLYNLEPQDERA